MKLSLLTAAAVAQLASAHYVFDTIVVDGVPARTGQYVRENTRQANYNPTTWEGVRDDMTPDSTDFRCNKGAFTNAGKTQTLEVKAGSKVAMRLGAGSSMLHPGPGLVYMSKAPTTAQAYEGEGDWFKIFEQGVCDKTKDFTREAWCTWGKDRIEFTIPKDLPDGEYLLRPEHIGIHGNHVGQAEFYYSCAQIKVTGGGNGKPGPFIKFPGGYKKTDPSFTFSIYNGYKEYPMPGPTVWTGGDSGANTTEETAPTSSSVVAPSTVPSKAPVNVPSSVPSKAPVNVPSAMPSKAPVNVPSAVPSKAPVNIPSAVPSKAPMSVPSSLPSKVPTAPVNASSTAPPSPPANTPIQLPAVTPTKPSPVVTSHTPRPHTDDNCGRKNRIGNLRRAFRDSLRKQ